jgi:hypothetical protein
VTDLWFEADLDLRIEPPNGARPLAARLRGNGGTLVLSTREPQRLVDELRLDGVTDASGVGGLADALAARQVTVRIEGPRGAVLWLGAGAGSPLGGALTGSANVGLGSPAAVWPLASGALREKLGTRRGRIAAAVAVLGAVVLVRARRTHRRREMTSA